MFKFIILLLLGLNSSGLFAENLLDIYQLGLQNDAVLQIARAEYEAEIESLPIASSFRKPQVDFLVTGAYSETDQSIIGRNSNGAYGIFVPMWDVAQLAGR